MTVYAFVFARGGSKGLPGKNLMKLGGLPLVAHSIRVAWQLPTVTAVFVSTDSGAIADVARAHGARPIARPPELATDTAPEWLAWQHAIGEVHSGGERFETFLSLPATSPLRSVDDAQRCLEALDADTDAVVTVTPSARSPYFNMVTRGIDGRTQLFQKLSDINRRQDAPATYDMTTVAYALRPDFILQHHGLFEGRVRSVVVPKERAVDVDDRFDFLVAQALFEERDVR